MDFLIWISLLHKKEPLRVSPQFWMLFWTSYCGHFPCFQLPQPLCPGGFSLPLSLPFPATAVLFFCEPLLRNEWVACWEVWMSCPKIMWRKVGKHWKFVPILNNWEVWLTWITVSIVNSLGLKDPSWVYILCWLGWSVDILGIHIADKV